MVILGGTYPFSPSWPWQGVHGSVLRLPETVYGVEQQVIPVESPWQNGKCERACGLWKEVWAKTVVDVSTLADAITATSIVTQTRNAFPRPNGYSPNQWVLGHPETRLPGSLLSSDGSQQLEVLEAAENLHSEMARTLAIREAARVAQIRLDSGSRVRRALLRKSTPTRGPYPIGSYVYFYADSLNNDSKMAAPTTGMDLRRSLDLNSATHADPATDGSAPSSYWLRYRPSVILASGEQLRFASEDELLAVHYVPHYAVEQGSDRGAHNYVDICNRLQQPMHQLQGMMVSTPIFGEIFMMVELSGPTTFPEKLFTFLMLAQYLLINYKMSE